MVKFLVIRLSSIGDIVLTSPVVRCLKQQVDDAEVHFLVKKSFFDVVKANPYIDKIHVFDNNLPALNQVLINEEFDYIIDLHKNIRSFSIRRKLKRISFTFSKLNFEKCLMVHLKINRLPNIHIVDRYFESVKLFDVRNDGNGLDFFIGENDEVQLGFLPENFHKGFIAFAIGAQHNTKKLQLSKMIEICSKLSFPVILIGDTKDYETAEIICKSAENTIYNACGKYSIAQSASIVKQARVLISHDSGFMHIGAAFKKKIISVWGNTIPDFGMFPYKPHQDSVIVEVENLKCRPCSKLGFSKCPKKHFNCMNNIDIQKICDYAKTFFNSND